MPVIVLNSKDSYNGRIFTLLHELTHLMLHENGLCSLEENHLDRNKREIEIYCNSIAGTTLIPKKILREIINKEKLTASAASSAWSDNDLQKISRRLRASKEVVLRRLLNMQLTTKSFYEEKRQQWTEQQKLASSTKSKAIVPEHIKVISRAGRHFTSLVFDNFYQNKISSYEISEYLGVKVKHINRIENEIMRIAID
ncbi:protein of unknown function DUF955 [Candidatus Magnetoovum chiemensis]|nr:protein of unknown function DUF955 [Candidatus Magnetoovum chiemensis]